MGGVERGKGAGEMGGEGRLFPVVEEQYQIPIISDYKCLSIPILSHPPISNTVERHKNNPFLLVNKRSRPFGGCIDAA